LACVRPIACACKRPDEVNGPVNGERLELDRTDKRTNGRTMKATGFPSHVFAVPASAAATAAAVMACRLAVYVCADRTQGICEHRTESDRLLEISFSIVHLYYAMHWPSVRPFDRLKAYLVDGHRLSFVRSASTPLRVGRPTAVHRMRGRSMATMTLEPRSHGRRRCRFIGSRQRFRRYIYIYIYIYMQMVP